MPTKHSIFLSIIMFLVVGSISYFYFSSGFGKDSSNAPLTTIKNAAGEEEVVDTAPKTEECPLNGELFSKARKQLWESRRPLGVAIENHIEARPQSGLSKADVVYEAVAEGGITRFLAMFYCQDAKPIGPVRSARIYFLKLLQGYGNSPLYAHVGGANTAGPADALGEIRDIGWDGYNDLNQFAVPFPYYYRDYERLPDRATEHTMYSSTQKLWEYAQKNRKLGAKDDDGVAWDKGWKPWKFADEAKTSDRGAAGKISFGFWSKFDADNYSVVWSYDPVTNTYSRSNGGTPHLDKITNKAIKSKNLVVVFADERSANDGYEGGHLLYDIVGSGTGTMFNNGKATKISWKKPTEEDMMRFYDNSGVEIMLVRGQVFVEILPTGNVVKY
ncbi:MAG: DUF3048 domain-containing protein [Microgenomates group bacterium]|jgi:hypothetical protein|nr:DUF3048 domain-containing protein [Candidatus Woesebacteria bacterium]MBP6882810.1 DUF3048 domain-containing protein [Candidatus Woesebacteria bacterium]